MKLRKTKSRQAQRRNPPRSNKNHNPKVRYNKKVIEMKIVPGSTSFQPNHRPLPFAVSSEAFSRKSTSSRASKAYDREDGDGICDQVDEPR